MSRLARPPAALALALAAAFLAPSLAASAEDPAAIGASVELRQSALTASLYGAGGDVRVALSATVHIASERGHWVNLALTIVGTPWPFEVTPSSARAQANADVPVTAWVDVPRGAAEGVYDLALRAVDGDSIFPIDTQAPFTVSVFRGPLALFARAEDPAPAPGGAASWTLTLWNLGSFPIDYDERFTVPEGFASTAVNPPVQLLDPGERADVTFTLRPPTTAPSGDYAWSARVTSSAHPEVDTSITVPFEVARVVPPPPSAAPDFLRQYWVPITLGVALAGVVAYLSLTEVGYLALAFSLIVPLFSRIRKERVLDNFTRGQIYGYIQANPGAHYSAIQQVLEIENGVLAYHLRVLLREEFLVARSEGVFKRFYPRDYKVPKGRTLLTRLQLDILEAVEKAPGISQREVARALGESKQVISYNVGVLRGGGLLTAERRGRDVLLRAPGGGAAPPSGPSDGAPGPSDLAPL
jgi:predicted transcriptional regulator